MLAAGNKIPVGERIDIVVLFEGFPIMQKNISDIEMPIPVELVHSHPGSFDQPRLGCRSRENPPWIIDNLLNSLLEMPS